MGRSLSKRRYEPQGGPDNLRPSGGMEPMELQAMNERWEVELRRRLKRIEHLRAERCQTPTLPGRETNEGVG
jgi:hypothetical protein